MSFSLALTPAQQDLVERTHAFARDVIRPAADYHDREQEFPWEILEQAAREGFYNPLFYRDLIGDPTGLSLPLFMEELFWGCAGIGLSIVMPALALSAIAQAATPAQLLHWAPECFGTPDELKLAALAISEPEGGSDVRNLRTVARRDGDEWVIDGHKIWIGNGGIADVHVVNATVDPELSHKGQALFIVAKGTPGLTLVRKLDKLGCRASHTAEIRFEGCRVPAAHLLGGDAKLERRLARARAEGASGDDGGSAGAGAGAAAGEDGAAAADASANGRPARGGSATLGAFEQTRPMVAAQALGIGRAALEFACDWAGRREAFGGPILDKQGVSFPLADLAADLDAARLLTWRASWMAAQSVPYHHAEGSMSKLKASEVAVRITEQAIQVAGGWGYIRDHPVEKWYRDAKLYTIFEGTSEIQRLVIGRTLGDAAVEPPLHHRTRTDGVALGRSLGRGTKRRSLAAGAAMRAARKTPPALMRPAMRILAGTPAHRGAACRARAAARGAYALRRADGPRPPAGERVARRRRLRADGLRAGHVDVHRGAGNRGPGRYARDAQNAGADDRRESAARAPPRRLLRRRRADGGDRLGARVESAPAIQPGVLDLHRRARYGCRRSHRSNSHALLSRHRRRRQPVTRGQQGRWRQVLTFHTAS